MHIIPPELVGKIMEFLHPNDIKTWLIISFINDKTNNKSICYEIKRTYLNLVKYNSIINYNLYYMYFNLKNILTKKNYLSEKWNFYASVCLNKSVILKDSLNLRDQLASKLDDKNRVKYLNLTNYISKHIF